MTAAAPLTFPLAGLLGEPAGTTRSYEIHAATIPLPDDLELVEPLEGRVEISRTNRGVLVRADIETAIAGECARCLRDIEVPISVHLVEEALPSVDPVGGKPLDRATEPDVARLTDHHELDFGTLVAEAISLAEPIAPLCEAACPGLCPTCGERLGPGHTAHDADGIDPRLAALRAFVVDDAAEDGATVEAGAERGPTVDARAENE
ncbi:MAG TPA: DUF177 domain-containing protein [Candidatus Eisenbacteria bacterium]|nr:DUF177 domain-containing protein [Candidatus Eisenbacteria bacterium]